MNKTVSVTCIPNIKYREPCIYQGFETVIFKLIIQMNLSESLIPYSCIYSFDTIVIDFIDFLIVLFRKHRRYSFLFDIIYNVEFIIVFIDNTFMNKPSNYCRMIFNHQIIQIFIFIHLLFR